MKTLLFRIGVKGVQKVIPFTSEDEFVDGVINSLAYQIDRLEFSDDNGLHWYAYPRALLTRMFHSRDVPARALVN